MMEKNLKQSNNIGEDIKYSGNITVTVKQKDQVISKKMYHNQGGEKLFKFLSDCIVNNTYSQADAPRYLKLFTFTGNPPDTTSGIVTNSTPLCSAIYLNAGETTTYQSTPAAYLHFTVPCSLINSYSENATATIYQAGLYGANYAKNEYKTNYCASFNFLEGAEWSPITVTSANGDYNIFIDWTLYFTNN